MAPQRLTIDATVARAYLDNRPESRRAADHRLAVRLFELAKDGEVELATAPQGYRLDADGDLADQLTRVLAQEDVPTMRQLAYPSDVTYPGEDLYPGAFVDGFGGAWSEIVASWGTHEGRPPGEADRFHVETHLHEQRDVFLMDDVPLLTMCRRLRDEYGFDVVAMTPGDFLAGREA